MAFLWRLRRGRVPSQGSEPPAEPAAEPAPGPASPSKHLVCIYDDQVHRNIDYKIARDLARRLNQRLPVELVEKVWELAGFAKLTAVHKWDNKAMSYATSGDIASVRFPMVLHTPQSFSSGIAQTLWFTVPGMCDASRAKHLAFIRLFAQGRNQGWCSEPQHGSYSWFSVRAVDQQGGAARERESHRVPISNANRQSQSVMTWHIGPMLEAEGLLQEGDTLEVRLNAQYPGWQCQGKEGKLEIYERFDLEGDLLRRG